MLKLSCNERIESTLPRKKTHHWRFFESENTFKKKSGFNFPQQKLKGAAVTEEIVEGFHFSRASYLSGLLRPQIIEELELKRYGLQFIPRNPSSFTPMLDGRYLFMGPDAEMTKKEIAKFSEKDSESYFKYDSQLCQISEFWEKLCDREPADLYKLVEKTSWSDKMEALKGFYEISKDLPQNREVIVPFLEMISSPATKILDKWFESEPLKGDHFNQSFDLFHFRLNRLQPLLPWTL